MQADSFQIFFVKMVATVTIVFGGKVFKGALTEQKPCRSKVGQKQPSVQTQVTKSRRDKIKKA